MKLLLGINLLLAVVVLTFLLLREDGRAPDQTQISRAATETEPEAKPPPRKITETKRRELPTGQETGEKHTENGTAAATTEDSQFLIEGILLSPEGEPVKNFDLRAYRDGKSVSGSSSDKQGGFRIQVKKPGDYLLKGTDMLRGVRPRVLVFTELPVRAGDRDLRIHLIPGKSGEIRALLTGFGKTPIPEKVQVVIKNVQKELGGYHRILDCPKGRMEIHGVAPGRYQLEFFIPGLLADSPVITVHDKQITDLGRIYFHPQGAITGVVLDEKGQAFPGVGVYAGRHYTGWLRPDPTTSHLEPPKASTRTDAAGRFATTGYRDPWTPISFVIQGYLPLDLMLTSADEARTLRLTLQAAATLEVRDFPRFTEVKGKQYPLTIWNLQAIRLNGSYALWKDRPLLQKGLREALPSQEEHFRVPDLPPGRYRIRLLSTERVVDRKLKKAIQIFVDREIELHAGKTSKLVWK